MSGSNNYRNTRADESHGCSRSEMSRVRGHERVEDVGKNDWDLPETVDTGVPWADLSIREKLSRVLINSVKVGGLLGFLYMFICSLDFLSSAFRLLGGKLAGEALGDVELLANPVAGLMLGVIATVTVQSSSTTTSIVVSMVSSELLPVRLAIPIIMGSNIGTTITNVLVSLGQIGDKDRFRRAFAGATMNDMFNWLAVLVLLPLEVATGYLFHLSHLMVQNINADPNIENPDLLKAITEPLTSRVIELDADVIKSIAKGDNASHTLIQTCCEKGSNYTCLRDCDHLFAHTTLNDSEVGAILLVVSLVILCTCLVCIVKVLHSLLHGAIAKVIKKVVNADFPGVLSHVTGYFVILIGAGITFIVQSSSITTATLTPLVGMGVIKLERVFPIVLGANIGTTFTSILAALASDSSGLQKSLQIAFCHLMFNLTGIFLLYVIWPARRAPISLAKKLGNITAEYRWFPIMYIVFMFFLFPFLVFGLSMAGWQVLVAILIPVIIIIATIIVVNKLQKHFRHRLPKRLQSWENLGIPLWMRSFEPLDHLIARSRSKCKGCRNKDMSEHDARDVQISVVRMGRTFRHTTIEESTPPRTREESTPSRTREESTPSRTREESTPSRTREERTPFRTREESTPSRTREESTPSRTREESTPSRTREESTPSRTRGESTPSGTREERTPSRTREESTPPRTREERTPFRTREESTPSRTREESTPFRTREESTPSGTRETVV